MKKILWLIFLSFLIVTNVDAKVYYSDYSDFSQFQEEEVFPSDTVDVIKEKMYLWYKNVNKLGDYKLYNNVDSFSNDCYMTEFTDWSNQKIDNAGYNYEERNAYYYTMAKGIRYIHLYNLQGSYGSFRIPELDIQYKDKSIKYTYTCNGCLEGFDDYINNGIYEENESYIANGGSLIIDLGKEYPFHLIDVIFYIFDLGNSDKTYTIGYSTDKENLLYYKQYVLQFSDEYWSNAVKRFHNIDEIDDSIWKYNETYVGLRNNDFVINKESIKQYRYQEKWCKVYETFKEYSEYSKEPIEDYIYRVDDSLKYFYSYRVRDKLELDIKEITSKDFNLNDFIVTSTDEVLINDDINWDKNGIYNVSFKLNNINVTEEVVLNVESNTISDLNKKIKYLEEQLNKLKIEKEKSLQLQENLNKEIISLKEQLYNCSLEKEKEIQNQNNLNDFYTSKTNELEEDIKNLNESIGSIIKEKENLNNSNVLKINDLEKNITKLNNDNKKLMEENNLCLFKLSNIKTPSNSNLVFYLKFVFLFLILLLLALLIKKKFKK